MRIMYYLDNWAEFMKLNVQKWMEYRANFFIGITAIVLANLVTIAFFWTMFQHIPSLNGWSFNQLLFMFGFIVFTTGIWHTFLAECNPANMDRIVRNGELDRYLLKPMNSLVHLSIMRLDDDGLGDLATGVALLAYSSGALGIAWTAQNILVFTALALGSLLVWFSLNIMAASMAFWMITVRSLMDVIWNVSRFAEYPLNIYNATIVWVLTYVLPLGFVSFYPSQYFLGNGEWMVYAYATPFVGLLMFALAYAFWSYGLKNYSSTGT